MALLKSAEADRFLRDPGTRARLLLLFGPDPGGVTDRAAHLAKTVVGEDPLAIVRIDADELGADPGRLADEAYGASLFSGRRVIRFRAMGTRNVMPAVGALLEAPPQDTWVIVEAGDLRKTAPLRRLFEESREALAIGCYPDTDASLGRMIDEEMRSAGLTIAPEARTALIDLIGEDRAGSRSEVRKLCLYAVRSGRIELADIAAIVGDSAALVIDDVVEAAALGKLADLDRGTRRLLASGTSASTILIAAERQFLTLHRLAAAVEAGRAASALLQALRPPPIPSRRAALERQLRLWSRPDLDAAVTRLGDAIRDSRLLPAISQTILLDALGGVGRRAARLARAEKDAQPG